MNRALLTERKIYRPDLIATFICLVRAIRTERERNWSISFNEKNLIRFMEVSDDFVGTVMRVGKRLVAAASLELAYCNRRLVSVSSAWKLDTVTVLPPATRYFYVEREREPCKSYEFYTQNGSYEISLRNTLFLILSFLSYLQFNFDF